MDTPASPDAYLLSRSLLQECEAKAKRMLNLEATWTARRANPQPSRREGCVRDEEHGDRLLDAIYGV